MYEYERTDQIIGHAIKGVSKSPEGETLTIELMDGRNATYYNYVYCFS